MSWLKCSRLVARNCIAVSVVSFGSKSAQVLGSSMADGLYRGSSFEKGNHLPAVMKHSSLTFSTITARHSAPIALESIVLLTLSPILNIAFPLIVGIDFHW